MLLPPPLLQLPDTGGPRPTSALRSQNIAATHQSLTAEPPVFCRRNGPDCLHHSRIEFHPAIPRGSIGQTHNTGKAVPPPAQLPSASLAPISAADGILPNLDSAPTSRPQCAHAAAAFLRNTTRPD